MSIAADRRRSPAPLAPLALAAVAGVIVDRRLAPLGTIAWAAPAFLAAVAAAWARPRRAAALLVLAAMAVAGGWHHRRCVEVPADDIARLEAAEAHPAWLRGLLEDNPAFRAGRRSHDPGFTRAVLEVTGRSDGSAWQPASGRVVLTISGDRSDLRAGDPVRAAGMLRALSGPLNPGEADPRPAWVARGVRMRLSVKHPGSVRTDPDGPPRPWRRRLGLARAAGQERLSRRIGPRFAPLAAALLLGRREAVDPDLSDAFAATGTTHLLAISGLHLQALAGAIWMLCRAGRVARRPALVVVMAATVGYALLVGPAPSVVRSAAMTLGFCLGALLDREHRPANQLAAAALAALAIDPSAAFDPGCQLSFLAVATLFWVVPPALGRLGIVSHVRPLQVHALSDATADPEPTPAALLDALERRLAPPWKKGLRRAGRWLAYIVVVSALVWLVGAPLAWWHFRVVAPVVILLNVPLIPLTTIALLAGGGALALSLVWMPLGAPLAWVCERSLELTDAIVTRGARVSLGHWFLAGPTTAWLVGLYGLIAAALVAGPGRPAARRVLAVSLVVWTAFGLAPALGTSSPPRLEADVLAVEHGLAVLIRSPAGAAVLYDCGRMDDPHVGRRVVAPALWARGLRRLDAVVLSHADADHYNGLPDLLDRVAVGVVRVPPGFADPSRPGAARLIETIRGRGVPVATIAAGDRLDLGGGAVADVLHPPADGPAGAADNAHSVVLDLSDGRSHLLLTGDLDGPGLSALLSGPRRPIDAILAPHHGGRSANPAPLYDWAAPRLVLASQRRPLATSSADALSPLEARGLPVLRTWRDGAVRLTWTPAGLVARGSAPAVSPGLPPLAVLSPARRWAIGLGGLLLGLAACLALAVVEWGAWALVVPGRRTALDPPEPPPWEPIACTAPDGVALGGAWLGSGAGRPTALLLHGFGEDRSALRGRAEALAARGWDVAVLDARGRGRSGGHRGAFGGIETDDLRAWLDALADRLGPGHRVAVWGRSMGAAIALRAAADDPRIAAVVLEAPYADLRLAVATWLRRLHLPGLFAGPILRRAARLAGASLADPRPIDVAPRVAVPALVLHGTADPIVSPSDARRLAASCGGPVEVVAVEDARHGDVFDRGGPALADRVAEFLARALA